MWQNTAANTGVSDLHSCCYVKTLRKFLIQHTLSITMDFEIEVTGHIMLVSLQKW